MPGALAGPTATLIPVHQVGPIVDGEQQCIRCHTVLCSTADADTDTGRVFWWSRGMLVAGHRNFIQYALNGRGPETGEALCQRR